MIENFEIEKLVKLILTNARLVHKSCLVGNPCQSVEERYQRLSKPQPGDLVAEMSALRAWETTPLDSLGRLITVRDLPYPREEDLDADEAEYPEPTRGVWFIETTEGRLVTWENCSFIVVFEDEFERWRDESHSIYNESEENSRKTWIRQALIRHNLNETN